MIDRQPRYPGRVSQTLEGAENLVTLADVIQLLKGPFFATLQQADDAITDGTLLSKANLLTDATASFYGLNIPGGTVNEAFAAIPNRLWVTGSYTGNAPAQGGTPASRTINLAFRPTWVLIFGQRSAVDNAVLITRNTPWTRYGDGQVYAEIVSIGFSLHVGSSNFVGYNYFYMAGRSMN